MKYVNWDNNLWQDKQWYRKKVLFDWADSWYIWHVVQEVIIPPHEFAKPHYHEHTTEVFYFLTEYGYWIVNGEKIVPKIGDVLLIEPHDVHTVINETDEEYRYLTFKINAVDNDLQRK